MLVNMDSKGKGNWATWIRTCLCSRGVSHVWLHQGMDDTDRSFGPSKETFKKRYIVEMANKVKKKKRLEELSEKA